MKVYIGGLICCSVNNDQSMLEECVIKKHYELTNKVEEADLIILVGTCAATYNMIETSFNCIDKVLKQKKDNAKVILGGCLARELKIDLTEKQKELLSQVEIVGKDEIIEYVARLLKTKITKELSEEYYKVPYTITNNQLQLSVVQGCLNSCSFCKKNYMEFKLKSIDFELLKKFAHAINEGKNGEFNLEYLVLNSSNLSLYGVDLYGRPRSHEVIKLLTSPESIKYAYVGSLINFYPELIKEIIENPKIKEITISLESGSERIYNLMNRPISLEKLKEVIRLIKRERPDIMIDTELIAGFPTETMDDVRASIDTCYELGIVPLFVHPYENCKYLPANKLPQHSLQYNIKLAEYMTDKLSPLLDRYIDFTEFGEMFVIDKNDEARLYIVTLGTGNIKVFSYDLFDKEYEIGQIIREEGIKEKYQKRKLKGKN